MNENYFWQYVHAKNAPLRQEDKVASELYPIIEKRLKKDFYRNERKKFDKKLRDEISAIKAIGDRKLSFEPSNEAGVIFLFGRFFDVLGFSEITDVQEPFPDITAIKDGKEVAIEAEFRSSNFVAHKHDPSAVSFVVCWIDDSTLSVPTIELKTELARFHMGDHLASKKS